MKRDMELIRQILIEVEGFETSYPQQINVDGYTDKQIAYNLRLMTQAGYLNASNVSSKDGELWLPKTLTWEGHEFLDAIRNDTVWKKINSQLSKEASTLPLKVIASVSLELTKQYAKEKFGLK